MPSLILQRRRRSTPGSPPSHAAGVRPQPRGGAARPAVFAAALGLSLPRLAGQEGGASLAYKYEIYQEADDRIKVTNHNVRAAFDLGKAAHLSVRGVIDTITGATPTGEPAPAGSDQVPLAHLEDERRAVVVDASRAFGGNTVQLEYAHSKEDDYVSDGYAATWIRDFNQKNTQLQLGFAYNDDSIQPVFFTEARKKASRDFLVGLVQLLDRNTVLTVNLSYGTSDGFLSDPYKIVQKTVEILPGFPLPLTFPENRPSSREKTIVFTQVAHHFENLRASLDTSFRYYTDSHGIGSATVEAAWLQKVGDHLVLSPILRYYTQSQADYYYVNLDDTPIVPVDEPDGSAPHYSSDYRLSKFDAVTIGLKAIWRFNDRWTLDATYERYDMRGRDDATPDSAYVTADILTAGMSLSF
ncbi:MAG: DUF3570 domain-containing protein [Opitutaceae bacterium]|nr:DUF3570 domain-containing protein [Opitutaceae bacterium]